MSTNTYRNNLQQNEDTKQREPDEFQEPPKKRRKVSSTTSDKQQKTSNDNSNQHSNSCVSYAKNIMSEYFVNNYNYHFTIDCNISNNIYFFTQSKYFQFSNFYPCHRSFLHNMSQKNKLEVSKFQLTYKNKSYKTSEHCYQAQKYLYPNAPTVNELFVDDLRSLETAGLCFKLANFDLTNLNRYHNGDKVKKLILKYENIEKTNHQEVLIRDDWCDARVGIMLDIVREKFLQNKFLQEYLFNTKNYKIVENNPYDYYWAQGRKKTGQNMLGKILMIVRDELLVQKAGINDNTNNKNGDKEKEKNKDKDKDKKQKQDKQKSRNDISYYFNKKSK